MKTPSVVGSELDDERDERVFLGAWTDMRADEEDFLIFLEVDKGAT